MSAPTGTRFDMVLSPMSVTNTVVRLKGLHRVLPVLPGISGRTSGLFQPKTPSLNAPVDPAKPAKPLLVPYPGITVNAGQAMVLAAGSPRDRKRPKKDV